MKNLKFNINNQFIKTSILLTIIFSMLVASFSISVSAETSNGVDQGDLSTVLNSEDQGDYKLTLPTDKATTYSVTLQLFKMYSKDSYVYGAAEVYYIEVLNADGSLNEELSGNYNFASIYNNTYSRPDLSVTISSLEQGSTVHVHGIQIQKQEMDAWGNPMWDNYELSYMDVIIVDETDATNKVLTNEASPLKLEVKTISTHTTGTKTVDFVRETTETFDSVGGSYTLMHLLNNYNVFSLGDIESTHIVGPIIAADVARRTTLVPQINGIKSVSNGYLAASDYSRGVFSYVGRLSSQANDSSSSGLQLGYGYDRLYLDENETFTSPYFYTVLEGINIDPVSLGDHSTDYIMLKDRSYFVSPNDHGAQLTYQNDNFFNFKSMEQILIDASKDIVTYGNAEGFVQEDRYEFDASTSTVKLNGKVIDSSNYVEVDEYTGNIRLNIPAETSWDITDATKLYEINLIMPDDYDYYDNPYLFPTTVNFTCEYINPIELDGVMHSQFPYTLISGKEFESSLGENGEYGEVGNKIVWNLPNTITNSETGDNRLITVGDGLNIAGHVVAPQAEFWNYARNADGTYTWEGGNINGCAIFKNFYSGNAEMHMWPYSGLAEKAVVYGVEVLKTVNGEEPLKEYTFELNPVLVNGAIQDGIINSIFPMTAQTKVGENSGLGKFSSLAFNKAGTYSFIIKEVTTADTATDNITYDLTEYQIDLTVAIDTEASSDDTIVYKIANISKWQLTDRYGEVYDEPILLSNDKDGLYFKYDNLIEVDTVNVSLHKKCSTGHSLAGAKFYVRELTDETGSSFVTGGYYEKVISEADGKISIENLEKETYYKFWEYEAPFGHVKGEGYWIIYIDAKGFMSAKAMDGAHEITDNTIYNEPEKSAYLDLTLLKSNQMSNALIGVNFTVDGVVINSDGVPEPVKGGYFEKYITGENGKFEILHLEANKIYRITETTTPENHYGHSGYWLITVTGNSLRPSEALTYTIVEYDENNKVVQTVENDTLMNKKFEFQLPNTGGVGTATYSSLGITLIVLAIVMLSAMQIKEKRKKQKI